MHCIQIFGDGVHMQIELFPAKGGCSASYSPCEILHHLKLNYKTQCLVPTLSYVLAHDEPQPSNTLKACAIDAIYLHPLENAQGGHQVYDLATKQVITHQNITHMPIT